MIILIVLVVCWTSYLVTKLVRNQHARTSDSAHPYGARTELPSGIGAATATQNAPAWGALDDRQLTRLLTDSAPRSTTE